MRITLTKFSSSTDKCEREYLSILRGSTVAYDDTFEKFLCYYFAISIINAPVNPTNLCTVPNGHIRLKRCAAHVSDVSDPT